MSEKNLCPVHYHMHADEMCTCPKKDNGGCPPDCGHSEAEHIAFDLGVSDGRAIGINAINRYCAYTETDQYEAWENGKSVGEQEHKEGGQMTAQPAQKQREPFSIGEEIDSKCPRFLHPFVCLWNFRKWRKARALDRAIAILWREGHTELAVKNNVIAQEIWAEIYGLNTYEKYD